MSSSAQAARLGGDDGAILVEFALFAPFLALVAMGILEFGLLWGESQTVATSMRAGARAASNTGGGGGNVDTADWVGLRATLSALGDFDIADIDRIVIYDATGGESVEGAVPPDCRDATIDVDGHEYDASGRCNIYGSAWLATYDGSDASTNFVVNGSGTASGCPKVSGNPVAGWCPQNREAAQGAGPDWVGIYVEYEREAITNLFGSSFKIRDDSAYRIEPFLG